MTGDFSVDLANRTLPLVRRIVEDLVRYHARWQEMVAACDLMMVGTSEQSRIQAEELQKEIQRTAAQIDGFLAELDALGVQFKGFEMGLVDFPGRLGDREVLLCWKMGEPSVSHWHEVDTGFAGRKPITSDFS